MSSQFLQTELLNLVQESKRKNSDLRHAAEESLNDLKALPSTSEAQISADLLRKPRFVNPFILACHSRHARLAGIGVVCLQRLVASRSLPSERLKDVLGGLKETSNLSLDIQLKILQTLPSLLQYYSNDLGGELLVTTLEICATLQSSKTLAVSSTAAATLQQLVVSTFERVSVEDQAPPESRPTATVKVDSGSVQVGYFAFDALRVLDDLCRLVDGEPLQFLRIKSLSPTFTLELIESVLLNSGQLFVNHPELTQVLRARLMPMCVRYLSERHSFAQTLRIARILLILLKRYLSLITAECEMALSLLTHLLEPDGTLLWKRVLCMEVFRGLYAEPGLVRLLYSLYDGEEGRKNVLRDHMASLVRLAAERPSLIGVSNRSTVPSRAEHARSITEEQITLEAGGVAGVIGTSVATNDNHVPGISNQWSVVRTPYLELLDKIEPPPPPDTYVYSLVLNCISFFAEGLAKFILPLTVPDLKQKRRSRITGTDQNGGSTTSLQDLQREDSLKRSKSNAKKLSIPINPLDLDSHPQLAAVRTCAGIIEDCWPAILATCSTFLYASLDDEFYHNLVRSFQKLAHVAGLLRLPTPRDAFLTTLGKASMPTDTGGIKPTGTTVTTSSPQHNEVVDEKRKGNEVTLVTSPTTAEGPSGLLNDRSVFLSTRNLLCLRALLNLGIALGPTLDQPAWSIILGTLQDTNLLVNQSPTKVQNAVISSDTTGGTGGDVPKANLGAELIAVQLASTKMFESTSDYPSEIFRHLLIALLDLSATTEEPATPEVPSEKITGQVHSLHPSSGRMRRSSRRVSHTVGKSRIQDEELRFVLEKAYELAKANLERLSSLAESDQSAWQLLTERLMSTAASGQINHNLRLRANEVLNSIIFETMKQEVGESDLERDKRQLRNLETLKVQVQLLYESSGCSFGSPSASVVEVHEQSLEMLKSIIEQYAETFAQCWATVFELISSVFGESQPTESETSTTPAKGQNGPLVADSPRLVQVAYKSLQLIASDFISQLPPPCRLDLVDSFSRFALQQQVFNISLTTTSSFWNVSDFLQDQTERFSIESHVDPSVSEGELTTLAKNDDPSISRNALWLLLLLRIVDLTTDSRSEIRNCAVHTLLRIFDAYGQQLSPKAWRLCLNRVLFRMVEEIGVTLPNIRSKNGVDSDEVKSWIETAVVMVKGVSDLVTNFFETIIQDDEFDQSWKRLLGYFQNLVSLRLLAFSEAVFSSLSSILLRVQSPEGLSKQSMQSTWSVWVDGHPMDKEDLLDLEHSNQDAAISYLQTFQQIYRLHKDDLSKKDIERILHHMRLLAWNSVCPRYSSDIDRPSNLQALIIDCTKRICLEKDDSQDGILLCLAEYVDSALSKWSSSSDPRRPTFVAFSKSVIDLLSWYVAEHGIKQSIFKDGSLSTVLEHLATPIVQRYEWLGKDREPSLWQKSTTASLNILRVAIPYVEKQYGTSKEVDISRFWKHVVEIGNGIIEARGYRSISIPRGTLFSDETFDIEAFKKLKTLLIPSLGNPAIPDSIRRDFAYALLHSSFIYLPQRLDLPAKFPEEGPLEGVYIVRPGRTFDPPPTARTRMAYVVLDTLFELASCPLPSSRTTQDISNQTQQSQQKDLELVLLARSISPYLILRCAVSLKGYIADQPLRGLMPQPTPARKALLHLLREMVNLRSEPSAIPPPPTTNWSLILSAESAVDSQNHKKHLEWIYPLVVQAVQIAGKERDNAEVLCALGEVLHAIGGNA